VKLYRTLHDIILESDGQYTRLPPSASDWDVLLNRDSLAAWLKAGDFTPLEELDESALLPPIQSQEVWAAGVTYWRSREARMEESKDAGGGSFYDRVYAAPRPELFFKATPHRVAGHGQPVKLRADSKWNVPEPELALAVNSRAEIIGYTIGNDMSSRDIEGENPLYLPQAKVYDGCCGLGPGVLIAEGPLPRETEIRIAILRGGVPAFEGATSISQIKRSFEELVGYLFRDNSFPNGCFLLTGTGIVPPDSFTLAKGDEVRISIGGVGVLVNPVG